MYSADVSGNNHRDERANQVRVGDRGREGIGGNQREDFTDVPLLCPYKWGQRKGHSGGGMPRFTPAPRDRIRNSSEISGIKEWCCLCAE